MEFATILCLKIFGLPPLHMQNAWSRSFWVLNFHLFSDFHFLFVALLRTFQIQKDGKIIFISRQLRTR